MVVFYLILLSVFVAFVVLVILNSRHGYLEKWKGNFRDNPLAERGHKFLAVLRFVVGIVAVLFFLAALAANVCSWLWKGISRFSGGLAVIHVGILLIFFFTFCTSPKSVDGRRRNNFDLPAGAGVFLTVLFAYTFLMFMAGPIHSFFGHSLEQTQPGGAMPLEKPPGHNVDKDVEWIRCCSGIWMIFSFISATLSLLGPGKKDKGPFGKFNQVVKRIG